MLRLAPIEFFLRVVPEGVLLIFAAYAFSKTKIDKKKYVLSTIMLVISVFIIRGLPINYGVHTILNIIMLTIIVVNINKIDVIKAIKATLITTVLLFICEGINVALLRVLVGNELDNIVKNEVLKTLYFSPSLFILGFVVFVYYNYLKRGNKLYYV